jgi:hypothetical protein
MGFPKGLNQFPFDEVPSDNKESKLKGLFLQI